VVAAVVVAAGSRARVAVPSSLHAGKGAGAAALEAIDEELVDGPAVLRQPARGHTERMLDELLVAVDELHEVRHAARIEGGAVDVHVDAGLIDGRAGGADFTHDALQVIEIDVAQDRGDDLAVHVAGQRAVSHDLPGPAFMVHDLRVVVGVDG
jgi:hypothetical protein